MIQNTLKKIESQLNSKREEVLFLHTILLEIVNKYEIEDFIIDASPQNMRYIDDNYKKGIMIIRLNEHKYSVEIRSEESFPAKRPKKMTH